MSEPRTITPEEVAVLRQAEADRQAAAFEPSKPVKPMDESCWPKIRRRAGSLGQSHPNLTGGWS